MSKQRPNLAEVVAAAGSTRKAQTPDTNPEPPVESALTEKGTQKRSQTSTRPPGTKQVAGHFPAEVSWQLRELALERRTTVQALLGEALNDLFQKHGKPEIAPSKNDD